MVSPVHSLVPTLIDPPELSPDYELPSQSFLTSPSLILSEPSPCTSKSPITMIVSQKRKRRVQHDAKEIPPAKRKGKKLFSDCDVNVVDIPRRVTRSSKRNMK